MPSVPISTKCSHLGCKGVRSKYNSFCLHHGGKDQLNTERYLNAKGVYASKKWLRLRQTYLSQQPLCQSCLTEGIIKSATDIDHVFAWQSLDNSSFIRNIFQSLCHSCHSIKTGLERKGIYRHFSPPTYTDYSLKDYEMVIGSTNTIDSHFI